MRLLYQFMKAEIDRLTDRYAAMMIRMFSIAWPVWLMVTFTAATRSG